MDWQGYFSQRQQPMIDLLRQLVELESPSTHKPSLDRVVACVADLWRDLGAVVEIVPQAEAGDQLTTVWPAGGAAAGPFLLLFHLDTVWPLGSLSTMPWRELDGVLYGPGVYDMKASVVIAWAALCALRDTGLQPVYPVRCVFTSDEELGSPTSRALIEAEARRARMVLCMEPALSDGALKTARKGVGDFTLTAYGRAAHAGGDHQLGINAIEELAHHILTIQRLTDYARGVTLNVGMITGGVANNIVPDKATLQVDFRVGCLADADWVTQVFAGLRPVLDGVRLEVCGGLNRPPMERTPQIAQAFEKARAIAAGIGIDLREAATGGGSDANFTAALGIPTLDGLGAVGRGAHSLDEQVLVASLSQRAALLAALLTQWK